MPVVPNPYPGSGQNPLVPPPAGSGVVPAPVTGGGDPIDLTTAQYAIQVLSAGGLTLTTAQLAILPSLITAASREICRYTGNRVFPLTTFTEVLVPEGGRHDRGEPASAKTTQFPIQAVASVMTGRTSVLTIVNTDSITNQIAQVAFTLNGDAELGNLRHTGLTLSRTVSATEMVDLLSFAGSPTIGSLAYAINALGGGWLATVSSFCGSSNPALYPSASLLGAREPKNALGPGACLDAFLTPASSYEIDRSTGILRCYGWGGGASSWGTPWDGGGEFGGSFGWGQYQVTYQAGWARIPVNLQQVCAELVKASYERLNLDANLKSETAGQYSWAARESILTMPDWATQTLNSYKDWSV